MTYRNEFREIYIFVAGATPQIITETVYALILKDPPVVPDEIYIITTCEGRRKAREALVERGMLKALFDEYGLPAIELKEKSFVLVKDQSGKELEDIRTETDNEALGECITSLIREKAQDHSARLHCSLAGGRKTMSYYLGAALQLFSRPWDRLYHVLVSPEFEMNPQFFFKPIKNAVIECKRQDGTVFKTLNTDDAEITIAELPFIRLGSKLQLQGKGFKELMTEGQKEIDTASLQPMLSIDLAARTLHVGTTLVELVPFQLMLYSYLVRQKLEYCRVTDRDYCLDCTECYLPLNDITAKPSVKVMAYDYTAIYGGNIETVRDKLEEWKGKGISKSAIRQAISKINKEFKDKIADETLISYCSILPIRKYGDTRYGLRLEKGKIQIK